MNEEQEREINNYVAQYNSILGNISIAKKELNNILDEYGKEKSNLKSIKLEIDEAHKSLDAVRSMAEEVTRLAEEKKHDAELIFTQANNHLRDTDNSIDLKKKDFDKYISVIKEEQEREITLLNELGVQVEGLKSLKDKLESSCKNLKTYEESLQDGVSVLEKSIFAQKEEISNLESEYREKSELFKKALSKYKEINSEEAEKATVTRSVIEEENRKLANRERNLSILVNRFRKEFKKLFPNQEPNI